MNFGLKIAVFANGCFWCTEAVFSMLRGVSSVKPGYTGGDILKISDKTKGPTYEEVCNGNTGYVEAIKIEYDPAVISDDEQKSLAEKTIEELNASKAYDRPVVTEVTKLEHFYEAEDYHHEYYKNHEGQPYCQLVIAPKLEKMQKRFSNLLRHDE